MTKLLILLLCACHLVNGQVEQKEINEQVWKPFIKTFSDQDTEGFLALHSKEVVRCSRDGKEILNWNQYYEASKRNDDRGKSLNRKRTIDLRFTERIASANQAIEVGIYKTSYINPDGTTREFYGKFMVALRKENGTWKILVDTDSSEGNTIDEKSFAAAKPIDE